MGPDSIQPDSAMAVQSLLTAIERDIDNSQHWIALSQLATTGINMPVQKIAELVIEALNHQEIELQLIMPFIDRLLNFNNKFSKLREIHATGELDSILESGEAARLLDDALLVAILQNTILHNSDYELLFTDLRSALLGVILRRSLPPDSPDVILRFTSALACYCLKNEFIFYLSPEEHAALTQVKTRIEEDIFDDQYHCLLLAILGCYECLADFLCTDRLIQRAWKVLEAPACHKMTCLHVEQRRLENSYFEKVEAFCDIKDEVSLAVQQQYNENPYPRWQKMVFPQADTFSTHIRKMLPHLPENLLPSVRIGQEQSLSVLIAGCGTGREAILAAKKYDNANIFAIDLSRASLAFAMMKAEEYGIMNLTFRQGDILCLPDLNMQFDVIQSGGVLHHMKDPAAGLAALDRCLKPDGWIRIALYSFTARALIRQAREIIGKNNIDVSASGIRNFRHQVMQNPEHELYQLSTSSQDFYSLSECRDLLFHVQEHQFTIDGIKKLIAPFGLKFMGFQLEWGQFKDKSHDISNWRSFDQWGLFEKKYPLTFSGMYVMWLRKTN